MEDPRDRQVRHSRVRDQFGFLDIRSILRSPTEFSETAENDTLVVRPDCTAIVLASGNIEPVVNGILGIDHATVLEPIPLLLSPAKVVGGSGASTVR